MNATHETADRPPLASDCDDPIQQPGWPAPDGVVAEQAPLPLGHAVRGLARCALRTFVLVARGRIRQPTTNVGRRVRFADGTSSAVYRETVIDGAPRSSPAVLVVAFRLRGVRRAWAHALFRLESELNTLLFAGFPGLVSKLWLRADERGRYRGLYDWDDPELAVAYVRALWWVLALVSQPGSIHYAVLPGLRRDQLLRGSELPDPRAMSAVGAWWRPVTDGARRP